jgi:hypothetical protein
MPLRLTFESGTDSSEGVHKNPTADSLSLASVLWQKAPLSVVP